MPVAPPRLGGRQKRGAWTPTKTVKRTERKRGRAGCRDRAQVRAEEPLCRLCLKNGLTVPTDVVDHIKPLAWGGSDDRLNKQGLCHPCHEEKSRQERAVDAQQRRRF